LPPTTARLYSTAQARLESALPAIVHIRARQSRPELVRPVPVRCEHGSLHHPAPIRRHADKTPPAALRASWQDAQLSPAGLDAGESLLRQLNLRAASSVPNA